MTDKCVILGGGGHAKVVMDTLQMLQTPAYAIVDANSNLWGKMMLGVPVRGGDDILAKLIEEEGVNHFIVGVGSTGSVYLKKRLYVNSLNYHISPMSVIHPTAFHSHHAQLGQGVQLMARAVVNGGTIFGENVLINTGAIVEHDCRVGNHVHIASGAVVCGKVQIGDEVYIGANATIRQEVQIGYQAIIGAGAVVIGDVPPHATVSGNPANPLRETDFLT